MTDFTYTIRNYQPADFDTYVRLNIESAKLEATGLQVSSRLISENLGRPGYSPQRDLFLAEMDGNIVGYLDIAPELAIGRVIFCWWIHPDHRRRQLATRLLSYALKQSQKLGADVAHVNISRDNVTSRDILSSLGFNCVRRFLELKLELSLVSRSDIDRLVPGYQHLKPGEEEKLTTIQNRSFGGSWGYNPNTAATITYDINRSNYSPEEIILLNEGEKITGYCWTTTVGSKDTGRIFMIGTDPDYQGKGVGRKVLMAGLAHLKNQGLRFAELTSDSQNEVALNLYRSVGFEITASSLWYEKSLN